MNQQQIHITGNAQGNAFGRGSTVINENSFNTQNTDLAPLLQALKHELQQAQATAASTAAPYVEAIATEAKKDKPSRSFLELTRNGLVEAAKTCAEIAPSLIKAANAVVDWVSRTGCT